MAQEDNILTVMRDEYKRCTDAIARDMVFGQQAVGIWTAVGALTFGATWNSSGPLILLVPPLFFFVIFHCLFRAKMLALNTAYAAALERAINEEIGCSILHWESSVCPKHAKQADVVSGIVAFVSSVAIICGSLTHYLSTPHSKMMTGIAWTEVAISAFLGIAAMHQVRRLSIADSRRNSENPDGAKVDIDRMVADRYGKMTTLGSAEIEPAKEVANDPLMTCKI